MESAMAARRKPVPSRKVGVRKASAPKTAGKTAGKTTAKNTAGKADSARKQSIAQKSSGKRWSQRVTQESDALDLKPGLFTLTDPRKIAASLKRSAEHSSRRKTSCLSLNAFNVDVLYQYRAGKTLPKTQRTGCSPPRRS
jgi:Protein of unknown function (DUF3175)